MASSSPVAVLPLHVCESISGHFDVRAERGLWGVFTIEPADVSGFGREMGWITFITQRYNA